MWFLPLVVEVLADFGITWWFAQDTDTYSFVGGLDFSTFINGYWFPLSLYFLMIFIGVWIAIPSKGKRSGASGYQPRSYGRYPRNRRF